jgi:hypothetical protein
LQRLQNNDIACPFLQGVFQEQDRRDKQDLQTSTEKRRNLLLTDAVIFITFSPLIAFQPKDILMNKYLIFIVRAIFSGVFALVLARIFRPDPQPLFIAGLGCFLLAAAYGLEYLRKKKSADPRTISH